MTLRLITALTLAAAALTACTPTTSRTTGPIDRAEAACADGRYVTAQAIADSIVLGNTFSTLGADDLCRLSLIFVHLGENSTQEDANMAFAAHSLRAARSLDSVAADRFIEGLPVADRSGMLIVSAIIEAADNPALADTSFVTADTIP